MIKIERHEKQVRVKIEHGAYYDSEEIWLYWNCNDELFAQLLTRQIYKKLDETIQKIRKEEYEQGWKDAKGKKKKQLEWFSPLLKLIR